MRASFIINLYKRPNLVPILDLDVYRLNDRIVELNPKFKMLDHEPVGFICGPDGEDLVIAYNTLMLVKKHFREARAECRNVTLSYSYQRLLKQYINNLNDENIILEQAVTRLRHRGKTPWI